jgi:TldD protein
MIKYNEILNQLDPQKIIDSAQKLGASYADFRLHMYKSETIQVENKILQGYNSRNFGGYGIRVVVDGAVGYSSTSEFEKASVKKTIIAAFNSAKSFRSKRGIFTESKTVKLDEKQDMKLNPIDISPREKVSLLLETNRTGWISDEIKNVITLFGSAIDFRYFQSSNGTHTTLEIPIIGLKQISVAMVDGKLEMTGDGKSLCAGYEFVKETDWNDFAVDVANLSIRTAKSSAPKAGTYPVVLDQQIVGSLIHEAFGHASEADFILTGNSILKDRLGEQVASEHVTVIDEGVTDQGGYIVPFDDEGVKKRKTIILKNGILIGYLHDKNTANELNTEPTGNSRAQDFEYQSQVRMTNTFVEAGDHSFDELLEGIKEGIYIKDRGSTGGEVNVGIGTFTFNGGESFIIRNGELAEQVSGVAISGAILNNLKTVDAVGKDLEISTSFFGACGKGGQFVKIGLGGPHLRIQEMTIGGK